ncbi:MAG: PQQ-dependent sugar dehydrogenase [Acidobacteriota bacterium]|nr:PQQ-dependent sugar dehydrogenase [Acidobacteriota bacterium]MDQ5871120.1 PQQ-dependent sugar dehydrogenase [Acidobacteriota bacterium]
MKRSERIRFRTTGGIVLAAALAAAAFLFASGIGRLDAQSSGPTMLVPNLSVRAAASGLVTPIGLAFLPDGRWLVLEKNTGHVKVVSAGVVQSTALDLAVNNTSERGLLGIALHPDFAENGWVYLFWSCKAPVPTADPFFPTLTECADIPELGADTDPFSAGDLLAAPLLGNRVDRFVWDDTTSTLSFDSNLIKLRSFQNDGAPVPVGQGDAAQPARGNHNGGIIRFGPDGKLYIIFGDVGRRGQLQNLPSGPTLTGLGPVVDDDQFGGPAPDDAHFSGVIIRLNDDGTTPTDNPFFAAGAAIGGEVGANIQRTFAYGIRNSFGMAFDPMSGNLWDQENGEDAFDEMNLVEPGMNSGWIQIIGPVSRLAEYKEIETTSLHHDTFPNLQQFRWGPERIADTPAEALSRLFVLPGSHYSDPEYAWKHVLAPAAIGFLNSRALGPQWFGDLFVGFSVNDDSLGGGLMAFELTGNRRRIAGKLVADNSTFHDTGKNKTHVVGRDFGIVTDIQTAPNGNLLVVSLDGGTVYEIFRNK